MDILFAPTAIIVLFIFFAYFIYIILFKKKFSFDNFKYVFLAAVAICLLYMIINPNSKVTQATGQYYKQRIDDRKQFWNTLRS